jgi:hypothetical protein
MTPPSIAARPRATESIRGQSDAATARAQDAAPDRIKHVFDLLGASPSLAILGADMFAEFTAARVPGKVAWCNYELARQLGFKVPASNCMTPEFHQQIIDALSYRAAPSGLGLEDRLAITMYADKYGGDGVAPALGSSRSGYLPFGDIFLKGVGHTPLFRHNNPDDFPHSHGGFDMDEGLAEVVCGEINANLISRDSSRILAIIDQDDYTHYPDGERSLRAIVARAGSQLRPGHVLARRLEAERSRLDIFISITSATGQLVTRKDAATGEEAPDIRGTMLRVIDDHARVAADQARWRITHSALSASNMQMNGGMLDVVTERAHPRSFAIRPQPHPADPERAYCIDYSERVAQMERLYRAVVRSVDARRRELLNAAPINIRAEMDKAYLNYVEENLLCAAGLKRKMARRLRAERGDLTRRFKEAMMKMTDLKNPTVVRASRLLIKDAAVIDLFTLLRNLPGRYFEAPDANQTRFIRSQLKPIYKGNRFHVASKRAAVTALIKEFADLYDQLMRACRDYAAEFYADLESMQESIKSRAAFENRPMSLLYRADFFQACRGAVREYKATGDADVIRRFVEKRVSASSRDIDRLLVGGESRLLANGGLELQARVIEGVRFSVRAWNDKKQTRRLHICIPVERSGGSYITGLPDHACLTPRQVRSLSYRITTDNWASWRDIAARLRRDGKGDLFITFEDACDPPLAGELEGILYDKARGEPGPGNSLRSACYVFAIPDSREMADLIAVPTAARK